MIMNESRLGPELIWGSLFSRGREPLKTALGFRREWESRQGETQQTKRERERVRAWEWAFTARPHLLQINRIPFTKQKRSVSVNLTVKILSRFVSTAKRTLQYTADYYSPGKNPQTKFAHWFKQKLHMRGSQYLHLCSARQSCTKYRIIHKYTWAVAYSDREAQTHPAKLIRHYNYKVLWCDQVFITASEGHECYSFKQPLQSGQDVLFILNTLPSTTSEAISQETGERKRCTLLLCRSQLGVQPARDNYHVGKNYCNLKL